MLDTILLTRRGRDTPRGLELEYWVRSEQGPLRVRITGERAVCFIERDVPNEGGQRKARELVSLDGGGRPVDALYFERQRDLLRERDALLARGHRLLEADIKPADRYLMERFVTGALRLEGGRWKANERRGFVDIEDPRVSRSEPQSQVQAQLSPSVLSFDIETDGFHGPVLSIAAVGCGVEQVWMVRGDAADANIELAEGATITLCDGERGLLERFCADLRALDPDILIGWNVIEFDLATLLERAKEVGVTLDLGRDGGSTQVLEARGGAPAIARVPGRVVLDGIASLRAASWSFESYALEDVAQELLGRGKHISSEDRGAEISRLYLENPRGLAEYNLEDCRLVAEIFERTGLLPYLLERQQLTGLALDRLGGSVAAFDYLYLPRLHRHGRVAPSIGPMTTRFEASPGGYVLDSKPGLYDNVLVLDFKSLYPSIIRTFKIDPLGLAAPGDDPVSGFEGATFSRDEHILPELIATLWTARDAAKARSDAAASQAIKLLMNSFYGVLGTPICRFFDPRLASSITRRGHELITRSRSFIEDRGHSVLYGDTDSLFLLVGADHSEARCAAIGAELAAALNTFWRESIREEHGLESFLEVEFETHYLRFFLPTIRGTQIGSKKRYVGSVRDGGMRTRKSRAEGEVVEGACQENVRLVFKGMEAVRTDWTPLARDFQRELYRRIFAGEDYERWVSQVGADLRAGKLNDQLVYRKRLRRDLDDYSGSAPPHVKAARLLERPGRSISYVITVKGPEPLEKLASPIDYRHYEERQLVPAADAILQHLGTSFSELGGVQLSLF